MKRRFWIVAAGFAFLLMAAGWHPAFAGREEFDAKMQPILAEYLNIADLLASDQTAGVVDAAQKMEGLAENFPHSPLIGDYAERYRHIPKEIAEGAKKMTLAADIESLRTAFAELSKPMVRYASMFKPSGINVVYCSTKPGSWLQKGAKINNPYYGPDAPSCGEIISGPDAKN